MNYLLDTNAILYFLTGRAPELPLDAHADVLISFITKIELLSYPLSEQEREIIHQLLRNYEIIYIDDGLIDSTICVRKEHRLKLPDSIIAATAIKKRSVLVTSDKTVLKKAFKMSIKTACLNCSTA